MEQAAVVFGNGYVVVNSKNKYFVHKKGNSIPILYVSIDGEDVIAESNKIYFDGFYRKYPMVDGREIKKIQNPEIGKLAEFVHLINEVVASR